jgi:hypothetical protein
MYGLIDVDPSTFFHIEKLHRPKQLYRAGGIKLLMKLKIILLGRDSNNK